MLERSTTESQGSENPKDAAVLRFSVFGSPFKLPKGINKDRELEDVASEQNISFPFRCISK